jgi:cell shape-determining protein MreC
MMNAVTSSDILTYLWIAVTVVLIVILYHALFIVVDARKIVRRIEDITGQVESMVLRPISMADQLLKWLTDFVEESQKHKKPKKKKSKKK